MRISDSCCLRCNYKDMGWRGINAYLGMIITLDLGFEKGDGSQKMRCFLKEDWNKNGWGRIHSRVTWAMASGRNWILKDQWVKCTMQRSMNLRAAQPLIVCSILDKEKSPFSELLKANNQLCRLVGLCKPKTTRKPDKFWRGHLANRKNRASFIIRGEHNRWKK